MSKMLGFGTICNFTANVEKIPFIVPVVPKDFNENTTVIKGGGIAIFPSAGPAGGTVSPVVAVDGDAKNGPWVGLRVDAKESLTQFSATLVVESNCAKYLKAQIVFVPDDVKIAPDVKTGVVRVSNPTRHSAIHIVTPFQFQPVIPGVFQVRFATTKQRKSKKPCTVTIVEDDTFSIVQYQTLPSTFQPGEY